MGYLPSPALGLLFLLAVNVHDVTPSSPFGEEQNIEGGLLAPPRSNVVMQSVVLGRRRPSSYLGGRPFIDDCDDCDDSGGLRHLLRRLLGGGRRRFLPAILPYKKTELDEHDSETIDNDTLERMVSAVKKARKHHKKKTRREESDDVDEDLEEGIERLVELEKEKPKRYSRARDGRKRREGRRKHEDDEEGGYWRRRKSGGEEEYDEPSRRVPHRRGHRRKEWVDYRKDEDKQKKAYEEEWVSQKKEPPFRKNQESRDILYLPPQYPQSRHYLRPRSSEEYIK